MTDIQKVQQTQLTNEVLDILGPNLRPSVSKQANSVTTQMSILTVVNSQKFGMRIAFASEVIEKIGSPDRVQVALSDRGIVIGAAFTGDDNYYRLKKAANKAVIYSSGLVREITDRFGLDFSNRTSVSFQDVSYVPFGDSNLAFFKLRQDESQAGKDRPFDSDNE